MIKKIIVLIICIALTVSLAGCGDSDTSKNDKKPGTIIEETDTNITIVDQANREVTVPKKIDSIALCYRVVIRFILSLDEGDKITGCGKKEDFLLELQPSLKDAKDVGQGVADIEALAELKPDVFFHKASDVDTLDSVEEIGIPAVGLSFETTDDMITALDIMGKVLGQEKKSKKLISYYKKRSNMTKNLQQTSKIKRRRS